MNNDETEKFKEYLGQHYFEEYTPTHKEFLRGPVDEESDEELDDDY